MSDRTVDYGQQISMLVGAIELQSNSIDKMRDELGELRKVVVEVNSMRREMNARIDHEVSERNHMVDDLDRRLVFHATKLNKLSFWERVSENPKIYLLAIIGSYAFAISDIRHSLLPIFTTIIGG